MRNHLLAMAIAVVAPTAVAADESGGSRRTPHAEAGAPNPEAAATRRGGPTLCECLNEPGDDPRTVAHCDGMLASLEMAAITRARAKCGEHAASPREAVNLPADR